MKRVLFLVLLLLLTLNFINCGPQKITEEIREKCIPSIINTDVNDGSMTVIFKENCTSLKSGYNIYISKFSLADNFPDNVYPDSVKPHNHPVFPGDTNPEDGIEHYEAKGLENGLVYYVSVRTVFSDRTLSKPSNELKVVCGPRGEIDLAIRYEANNDGFSFIKNDYVRADDIYNDLYMFTKNNKSYLASPNRLNGFLRTSKFRLLANNSTINEVIKSGLSTNNPYDNKINISKGNIIQALTADGHTVLLEVADLIGEGRNMHVKLKYAFTIRTSVPFF